MTSELFLFVQPREGGVCSGGVLHKLMFTIPSRDCHSASPPGAFSAAPHSPGAVPTPLPAASSRAQPNQPPPRPARAKMRQQKRRCPCPSLFHASLGGTPHPAGGKRKQRDSSGGGRDGEVVITPFTAQGSSARRQSWLSTGCRRSRQLSGVSWEPAGQGGAGRLIGACERLSAAPPPRSKDAPFNRKAKRPDTSEHGRGEGPGGWAGNRSLPVSVTGAGKARSSFLFSPPPSPAPVAPHPPPSLPYATVPRRVQMAM